MSMRQGSGDRVEGAHAMRAGPAGGVVASAIFGVALLVARTLAAKIERNPDPGHILGWEAPDALVQVVASFQD